MACAIYKAGNNKNAVPYCALREAVQFFNPRRLFKMCCGRNEDFLPLVGKMETSYSRRWTRSCLNSKIKLAFPSAICLSNISLLKNSNRQ